jgi:hypothetical protein
MKPQRKLSPKRKTVRRRAAPLSLSARIERLEKAVLFPPAVPTVKGTAARFVNLGDNGKPTTGEHVAVYDRETGLTWSAGPLLDGKEFNHTDALKACADLDLMDNKDWRAPTIKELLSIVDYKCCDPAVDTAHFKGPYSWTWSSTIAAAPSGYAWIVDLFNGYSSRSYQGLHGRVRAVRAGQPLGLSA